MTDLSFILILFASLAGVVVVVFLIDKFQDKRKEQSRNWQEIEGVWLDVNSGEVKFYLNDDGSYKFKKIGGKK